MAKAAGVDIGSRAVKVAVVDGGPKGGRLLRFVEKEYPSGDAPPRAEIVATLKQALSAAKAPRNAASLAIAAERCILRSITVPFTSDDQIAKVVKFEFEPHLHSAAIEDVVVDYVATGPARKGTRLLVMACEKATVGRLLEEASEAGVDPLHADVDVAALWNVAEASGALAEHPNCLVIDIGARTTKTLLVTGGRLKVARSIRIGASSAARRLTSDFEGDSEAAERALEGTADVEALAAPADEPGTIEIVQSVGAIETAAARARHDQFIQRVMRETQRSLPMMDDDSAITCVWVTGGGIVEHPNARLQLEERFEVPVLDLPVHQAAAHKLAPSEADTLRRSGAVALGTALKVLGVDAAGIDLRQEEYRFARTFDQVKTALAVGVTCLFFIGFLLVLATHMKQEAVDREIGRVNRIVEENLRGDVFDAYEESVESPQTLRISDDPHKKVQTVGTSLRKIRNHLENELGLGTLVPPPVSSLRVQKAVLQAVADLRKEIEFLAILSEDYDQDKATLTVVVARLSDIDKIVTALRKHTAEEDGELFEEVAGQAPKPTKTAGHYSAAIKMTLLPQEAGKDRK